MSNISRFAVAALCASVMAGCGTAKHSAHLTKGDRLANVCGNIRAELAAVSHEMGFRDPVPALFKGQVVIDRLLAATPKALRTLDDQARELTRVGGGQPVNRATVLAKERYEIFARHLAKNRIRTAPEKITLIGEFEGLGLTAARDCETATR